VQPVPGESPEVKTFTQDEVQAAIEEAKKGLLANRDEALKEAKQLRDKLKAFDGVDPEKHRELMAAAEKAEREKQESAGNWKALESQLIEKHTAQTEKLNGRITQLSTALERRLVDAEAASAIAELKGSVKGLLPHVKPHIRVVEQDGEFVAQVVDSKGNPRISDAKGTPMSIRDLVAEFKNDGELGRLFEGSGSSGGGASRSNAGGGGSPKIIAPSEIMAHVADVATGKVQVQTS
jgi:hypothetical protein